MSFALSEFAVLAGSGHTHFVPMFLHTALSAQRKSLRDLTPTAASISQSFESLFFGWRPGSIRSALFGQRAG